MTEGQLHEALTEIFQDVFMRDDIELTPDLTARMVPGWDSLKQINIILATEERFGVKFTSSELEQLYSVGDLMRLVLAKDGTSV